MRMRKFLKREDRQELRPQARILPQSTGPILSAVSDATIGRKPGRGLELHSTGGAQRERNYSYPIEIGIEGATEG